MGILDSLFASGGSGLLGNIPRAVFGPSAITSEREIQARNQAATYDALSQLMPPDIARAATLNPDILKQVAPEYFGGYKLVETGNNPITGSQKMMQGPGGKLYPVETFMQGGQGAAASGGLGGGGMLAKGVSALNSDLTGNDYLAQFSPEVQAAVKAYMSGDVLPTGNARNANINTVAKTIAQKVGQDLGTPVSDATYSERRKFRMELGSGVPSSVGGQTKSFAQATEHLAKLAPTLAALNNYDLGIAPASDFVNWLRQGTTSQKAIADRADTIGQALAGEIGKLFSGTQGGGVHERELTRSRFNTVKSPQQLSAAIDGTLELMQGGLHALEGRRDSVFGPNSNIKLIDDNTANQIKQIQEVSQRLKAGTPAAAEGGAFKPPSGWQFSPSRKQYRDPSGGLYDINGKPL